MQAELVDFVSPDAIAKVLNGGQPRPAAARPGVPQSGVLRLEYQRWLERTWLFVGRLADFPEPGCANTAPGLPVFLVRDHEGVMRAFHNACRHRGHRS